MTQDEQVNGPQIAARIISRMDSGNRERILTKISQQDPALLSKIKANMLSFEDLAQLNDQSMQRLIKEVDHKDLLLAMKRASEEVTTILLNNMSERKKTMIVEDIRTMPPVRLADVEGAQQRIVQTLDKLREAGVVRTVGGDDEWVE